MAATLDGFETATEMVRALRGREVSASELLELHLRRIERHNPRLNAVVIPDFDRARRDAAAADVALARDDEAAPLLGLPITVKDAINTEGLPTTGGVESRAEAYPEEDALIVMRLRGAGAVIMGKTNVPPYLADWQADNPLFGRTNNPWDLERAPGGSTGGGGAALAAGLTPLEFGSDIGGSIRFPAAWCGVYGHRPSLTALPRSGHFPPLANASPNPTLTLNTVGPLARSAEDLELALDVTAGPEIGEEVAWRLELPPARHERLADFRVAVLPGGDWRPVDGEIVAAIERLATSLRRAGARVAEAQPEALGDLHEHHDVYQSLLTAVGSTRLSPDERRARAAELRAGGDPFGAARARGLEASAADYIAWHEQRARYQAAWRAFFREWDVVLAPMVIVPAPLHSTLPPEERVLTVDGQTVPARILIVYSAVAIFSGLPSTAFPLGLTQAGLPIGLQAIGPYLEDRTPIRFAGLVARELGGFQRPPGYD